MLLRALAVSSAKRSPALPDTPTLKELGYNIEGSAWYAFLAPAATPPARTICFLVVRTKAFMAPPERT